MNKPTEPIALLREIEAYLAFQLISETPTIPEEDMRSMKADIVLCLEENAK